MTGHLTTCYPLLTGPDASAQPATPHYNTAMLTDLVSQRHLEVAREALSDAGGVKDGIALLKVWLHQRQLDKVRLSVFYQGAPCRSYKVLKCLIYVFPFIRLFRKVLSLGVLDQRSLKGLILNATEFFQILEKFSFKEISKLSRISKLMHLDLKVYSSCLIKPGVKKFKVLI